MANTAKRYVSNLDFDGAQLGEVIEADPKVIADWIDAGYVSEIDENGNRLVAIGGRAKPVVDDGAQPVPIGEVRPVTKDDVAPAE